MAIPEPGAAGPAGGIPPGGPIPGIPYIPGPCSAAAGNEARVPELGCNAAFISLLDKPYPTGGELMSFVAVLDAENGSSLGSEGGIGGVDPAGGLAFGSRVASKPMSKSSVSFVAAGESAAVGAPS